MSQSQLHSAGLLLLLAVSSAGLARIAWENADSAPLAPELPTRAINNDRSATGPGSLRDPIPSHRHALLGHQAPDFKLADPDGKVWSREQLNNDGPVVLIFYFGCRCESCARHLHEINRDLPLFHEVGARVVAISADPPDLTRQWLAQNEPVDFTLLSDPGNEVATAYQVFKGKPEFLRHGTFLLDRNGSVRWVNVADMPFRRNLALLDQLSNIEGQSPAGRVLP